MLKSIINKKFIISLIAITFVINFFSLCKDFHISNLINYSLFNTATSQKILNINKNSITQRMKRAGSITKRLDVKINLEYKKIITKKIIRLSNFENIKVKKISLKKIKTISWSKYLNKKNTKILIAKNQLNKILEDKINVKLSSNKKNKMNTQKISKSIIKKIVPASIKKTIVDKKFSTKDTSERLKKSTKKKNDMYKNPLLRDLIAFQKKNKKNKIKEDSIKNRKPMAVVKPIVKNLMGSQKVFINKSPQNSMISQNVSKTISRLSSQIKKTQPVRKPNKTQKEKTQSKQLNIQAGEIDLVSKQINNNIEFEIRQHNNIKEIKKSVDGQVSIQSNKDSMISFSVLQDSFFVTNSMYRVSNENIINIPLMKRETLQSFLKQNLNENFERGGILLCDIDEDVIDIKISSKYSNKITLDEDFKVNKNNYRYVMFINVEAGNIIIDYLTDSSKVLKKIEHIYEEEITYDYVKIKKIDSIKTKYYSENVLSKKLLPLNISEEQILKFSDSSEILKESLNGTLKRNHEYILNTKNYDEYVNNNATLFFNTKNNKVSLPNEKYIEIILEQFNVDKLEDDCIIQMNIEDIKSVSYDVQGINGAIDIEVMYLNIQGEFTTEITTDTNKIIMYGQEESIVNLKIEKSTNERIDDVTFCSSGTYLLEQY
jgi:hypothetical protein